MSLFHALGHYTECLRPRPCVTFRNMLIFYGEELLAPRPTRNWRTTPRRLSATAIRYTVTYPASMEVVSSISNLGNPLSMSPVYLKRFMSLLPLGINFS
jgi:hypothetical protein